MRLFLHRFPALGGSLLFTLLCTAALASPKYLHGNAATVIVTNTADSGPGSLRQTLADAHDGDTIQFDPALNGQTIRLTSGELVIDKNITISGPGWNQLTVSRSSGTSRIFHVMPGQVATIHGLTITNGFILNGGGILNDHATLTVSNCIVSGNAADNGGGILNDHGTVTIDSSLVTGNGNGFPYGGDGGGICSLGDQGTAVLTITNSSIDGNGGAEGGGIYNYGGTVSLSNSSVSNNWVYVYGAFSSRAGGIYNFGTLEITDSIISNNTTSALGDGGGIISDGSFTLTNSIVTGNSAGYEAGGGGGIVNGGSLIVNNCTISSNHAPGSRDGVFGYGGAIANNGTLEIVNSALDNNSASASGGAIYSGGTSATLTISNSTFSGNVIFPIGGSRGGAIANNGPLDIAHSTFHGNSAGTGGGVYNYATLRIGDSILDANTGINIVNEGGTVTSLGYNLSSDDAGGFLTGPGDQINTEPLLGPLQNNGGPTLTHALLIGSPAIDLGNPKFTPPPFTDQRGYGRVSNERIDIGSFEAQPIPTATPTPGPATHFAIVAPTVVLQYHYFDLTVTAQDQFNHTVTSYTGTVHFTSTSFVSDLPPDSTLTNGTGTFSVVLGTYGGQSITVRDTINPAITSTSIIIVNPKGPQLTPTPFPTATPCTTWSENFDRLPPGPIGSGWVISAANPQTPPNDAFTDDPPVITDKHLDLGPILIQSASATLSFPNLYNLETNYDGGVLEVSSPNINGGAFTDITDAAVGGTFLSGGYNSIISTAFMSPIAGRMAWSGYSSGYIFTSISLGPNLAGQTIALRFRFASDNAGSAPGWRLDTLVITDEVCPTPTPSPSVTPSPTPTPGPAQSLNLSTRLQVGTGVNIGIAGFIIGGETGPLSATSPSAGSGPSGKRILVRGIGPSLTAFGVPGAIPDTTLELHAFSGALILSNDNWRDTQEAEIQATGIPPPDNLESALIATVQPGQYTALLAGKNEAQGVGLVEVYDLTQSGSQLLNLSTRAFVSTADNVVIAGFILGQGNNTNLVIRGLGPSLIPFGVPHPVPDPTLELRDSNGALLVTNDNWQDDPASAAQLTAHGLAPQHPLESGIFTSLPPGAFSAILAGNNGGTGGGLVEIYNLQ